MVIESQDRILPAGAKSSSSRDRKRIKPTIGTRELNDLSYEELSFLLSLFTTGILGLGLGFTIKELRELKDQSKLSVFTTYTTRYSDIIEGLPTNVNEKSRGLEEFPDKSRTMNFMRRFFDLCSEEFYLHQRKFIDNKVWKLWGEGMSFHLSFKSVQDAWLIVKVEGYDTDFVTFIQNIVEGLSKTPTPGTQVVA